MAVRGLPAERRSDVQSVRRALALLKVFSRSRPELSVTEAARLLGVHPSSASRLLATLADAGFVRQDPESGRYRPGFAALELASVALHSLDIRAEAIGVMRSLSARISETVNLAVLDETKAVVIEQAPVESTVRFVSWIGRRLPLHATAHGKAHLAFLASERREPLLAAIAEPDGTLQSFTPDTIVTRAALDHELSGIRQQGYVLACGEFDPELAGVAVPIFGHDGAIIASMSISGPLYRMPPSRLHELARFAIPAGQQISARLGWSGDDAGDCRPETATTDLSPAAQSAIRTG
ncbi:MAG: IclR family transcriptional regulator [Chloroflexi bacterium]|nr:IclR family transcriptional regulator [Chloroflexota bacterium]